MLVGSLLVILVAAAPTPNPAAAPAAPRTEVALASPDFTTLNVAPALGRFCAEQLAQKLGPSDIRVMTSREITSLIGVERQRELLGCSEGASSCIAELGNALGADGILLGDVTRLGTQYQLSVRVVSSDGRRVLARQSTTVGSEQELLGALDTLSRNLAPELRQALGRAPQAPPAAVHAEAPALAPEAPGTTPLRSLAWIPAASAGVLAAGSTVFVVLAASAHATLTTPPAQPLSPDRASALVSEGGRDQTLAQVGYGLAGAALVTAALFYLAPGAPPPAVTLAPAGPGIAIVGSFP